MICFVQACQKLAEARRLVQKNRIAKKFAPERERHEAEMKKVRSNTAVLPDLVNVTHLFTTLSVSPSSYFISALGRRVLRNT